MNKATIETAKFVIRLALLFGTPLVVAQLANLTGNAQVIVGQVLPILLPIIDKWVHEDDRIPAKGVLPF